MALLLRLALPAHCLLLQQYPSWQVLLVDLRCHGESAALPQQPEGPHTVSGAVPTAVAVPTGLPMLLPVCILVCLGIW